MVLEGRHCTWILQWRHKEQNALLSTVNSRVRIKTEVSLPPKPESYIQPYNLLKRLCPNLQILWEPLWTQIFLFLHPTNISLRPYYEPGIVLGAGDIIKSKPGTCKSSEE